VVVERGRGIVDIARVTGASSDGKTVDVVLLAQFVKEMYVEGPDARRTYERIEDVRVVPAEFAPVQQGWIVLDADLALVKQEFAARVVGSEKTATVVVTDAPKTVLTEDALRSQRGFPRPTKTQALVGAALSLPVASLMYSGFAGARQAYVANPVGDDAASAAAFRQAILLMSSGGAVLALIVGSSLLIYALGGARGSADDAN
jgi:hypothetical protein